MNVAASVRLAKEKNPQQYCRNTRCLWRTTATSVCPRHCQKCGAKVSECQCARRLSGTREERGRDIAEAFDVVKAGGAWVVPSQCGPKAYEVTLDGDSIRCTCPDHKYRRVVCKHIYAAAFRAQEAGYAAVQS